MGPRLMNGTARRLSVDGASDARNLAVAGTLSRGLSVPFLIIACLNGALWFAVVLVTFVVVDVADGEIARRLDLEHPRRRYADTLVDRLAVHSVFCALAFATGTTAAAVWLVLIVRDLMCFLLLRRTVLRFGAAIMVDGRYKAYNLWTAAVAVTVAASADFVVPMAVCLIGLAVWTTLDLRAVSSRCPSLPGLYEAKRFRAS